MTSVAQPKVAPTRRSRRRCKAMLSDRSRRCARWAMAGQEVCQVHGGASPQARRGARERLLEAADPAAAALVRSMEFALEHNALMHPTLIKAATAILDRAGFPRASRVELEQVEAVLDETYEKALVQVLKRAAELAGLDLRADSARAAVGQALREHAAAQRGEAPPPAPQPTRSQRGAAATAPPAAGAGVTSPAAEQDATGSPGAPAEPEPEPEVMVL